MFISAVMLINSVHVSGFVKFPDDPSFLDLALLLLDKLESKALTFSACSAASAAASASVSACSSSACFSAAILSRSSASASASNLSCSNIVTSSACAANNSSRMSLALFKFSRRISDWDLVDVVSPKLV